MTETNMDATLIISDCYNGCRVWVWVCPNMAVLARLGRLATHVVGGLVLQDLHAIIARSLWMSAEPRP